MKKTQCFGMRLLVAISFLVFNLSASAQGGLSSGADLRLGYSEKVFTTALGYDLGYKWKDMLYLGAGPMVAFATGHGSSAFSAGGYGKLRFIVPIDYEMKPFAEGRVGYGYNFKAKVGGMLYGAAVGVKYKKFIIGFYLDISSTTTSTTKTSTAYSQHSNKRIIGGSKSSYSTPSGVLYTNTTTVDDTEWHYTPSFLIGIEF